jgi:hypothetical protein
MNNPYQSPSIESDKPSAIGAMRFLRVTAWLYPAILVAAFYATWLVAWLFLGHMPRPSLDDPKSISILVDVPYTLTGLLLVAFPAAAIAGGVMQLSIPQSSWIRRLLGCSFYVAIWISAISFLRWDPLQVGTWFMD